MILGKFMPPHLGHVYLADFARKFCDRLTILVCSIAREPIPGHLRYRWMREMFPTCDVVHIQDELPQEPCEHEQFWPLWTAAIRRVIPTGPDFVFASEPYGQQLAEVLSAKFMPVDIARDLVPISATAIRDNPLANWRFIPPAVRPHYVKRICIFGPESTGKSTLARQLAAHFQTVYASEYARPLLDLKAGHCDPADFPFIARGQLACEDALARQANRVLFCDTDLLTTSIWHEKLVGLCPTWLLKQAAARTYDLYLLLDIDVPWVNDGQRFFSSPADRQAFFEHCENTLKSRNKPYIIIRGNWKQRLAHAIREVNALLDE
jgi:HTH-type transcriptional regulator, transcriptional repressor of NAD biosynthesis genes